MGLSRPANISIDLNALVRNQSVVRRYVKNSKMVCCVKANAYGHGIVEAARALTSGADALAVASIEEAITLRDSGLTLPILLLEGFFDAEELALIGDLNLWTVVHNSMQLKQLRGCESRSKGAKRPIDVWLKIDTGMHRLGFHPDSVKSTYDALQSMDHVGHIRLMTHFACADELDNSFTNDQIGVFDQASSQIDAECSAANSAGILGWPQSHKDWVRPGYMLYGQSPFGQNHPTAQELEPAMSFRTRVMDIKRVAAGEGIGYNHSLRTVRESDIAVLAVGYGDGYPRNTRNGTPVLVNGQRAKTVGHVAMDMMMVDVTGLESVQTGTEAELWGRHLSVNEVAQNAGYSPYELLTRMPPRVGRRFSPG